MENERSGLRFVIVLKLLVLQIKSQSADNYRIHIIILREKMCICSVKFILVPSLWEGSLRFMWIQASQSKVHVDFSLDVAVKIYFNKQERWSGIWVRWIIRWMHPKCATSWALLLYLSPQTSLELVLKMLWFQGFFNVQSRCFLFLVSFHSSPFSALGTSDSWLPHFIFCLNQNLWDSYFPQDERTRILSLVKINVVFRRGDCGDCVYQNNPIRPDLFD